MGSHRRSAATPADRAPGGPVGRRTGPAARATVLSAAVATAATALASVPAGAVPEDDPARARADVERLFQEAERATEAYNGAGAKEKALRERLARTQDRIARSQDRINELRQALGPLAGAQYRAGGVDPAVGLLLSAEPDEWLHEASVLERVGTVGERRLRGLRHVLREVDQERAEARRAVRDLERSRRALARHKRVVTDRLARARELLARLPGGAAALDRASRGDRAGLALPDGGPAASPRAAAALAAARSALGRPYVWGANGPSGFDCSGLVQWSYAHAGVSLPRTSQAQTMAGTRVPLSRARPGDLVAYHGDASHIGIYAGNGQVVHAPYPGAPVRYDPVGMMPVSSVTRV